MHHVDPPRSRVTGADVAREAGVSRATVGYVLNGTPGQSFSEATVSRVFDAAKRLGYRPHVGARALAGGSSKVVLALRPDWSGSDIMASSFAAAERELAEEGFTLIEHVWRPSPSQVSVWASLKPDVVVLMSPLPDSAHRLLAGQGFDKVIQLFDSRERQVNTIAEGFNDAGPRPDGRHLSQIEHLVALGHRRIAVASSSDPALRSLSAERTEAVRNWLSAAGLPEPLVAEAGPDDIELVSSWSRSGVTGIVAYNDEVAAGVIRACIRAQLDVPGALSVVGHDDSRLASLYTPSISSLRLNPQTLGQYLAQSALSAIDGRDVPLRSGDVSEGVVQRESTGPVPR